MNQEIERLLQALSRHLQQAKERKITGELALVLKLNAGGVRSARVKTEEEITNPLGLAQQQ